MAGVKADFSFRIREQRDGPFVETQLSLKSKTNTMKWSEKNNGSFKKTYLIKKISCFRTKIHDLKNKLTRVQLVDLVQGGQHPFCKDIKLIPGF